jgi:hypothetical protein
MILYGSCKCEALPGAPNGRAGEGVFYAGKNLFCAGKGARGEENGIDRRFLFWYTFTVGLMGYVHGYGQ